MSKKNRPSVLKREREQKKRQRVAKKAEKAALKRARREGGTESGAGSEASDGLELNPVVADRHPEVGG